MSKMTTQFLPAAKAAVLIEEFQGQVVEKRINFSWKSLDYSFSFKPPSETKEDGPTLTYVGNQESGRLSPSEYAEEEAWIIARAKMGLPPA
jgi:hypothetical protein